MSKQLSVFWWYWLVLVILGVILFSLAFVLLPDGMQGMFKFMFFASPEPRFGQEVVGYLKFVYGVLGAVMAGWMVTLLSIVMRSFRRGEREAWNTITISITVWFMIDTAWSIIMGFPQNAVFNLLFLVLFAIPLAATRQQFLAD